MRDSAEFLGGPLDGGRMDLEPGWRVVGTCLRLSCEDGQVHRYVVQTRGIEHGWTLQHFGQLQGRDAL